MKKNKYLAAPHSGNKRGNHRERHSGMRLIITTGVFAIVLGAVMPSGTPSHAGFIVDSLGGGHGLKKTPASDIFGNSLDNLKTDNLSDNDLNEASLDYSACGVSPLPSYILDYLETKLDKSVVDTSDWQNDIDAIANCEKDAASWKIGEVNAGVDGHSPQNLTADMFDEAIGEGGYTNGVLAADSTKSFLDVANLFPGILSSISPDSLKTLVAETVVGFDDKNQASDYLNHQDKASYQVADFKECHNSTVSVVGGAANCSVAHGDWQAVENVIGVANGALDAFGVQQSLTGADITAVLSISGETINPSINTADPVHLDYLTECVSGSLDAASQLIECDSEFTAAGVSLFEVGQIVSGASGYSPTGLTTALLQETGALASSSDAAVVSASVCGTSGANSCLSVLRTRFAGASFSDEPTTAEVDSWVRDVIADDLRDQATAYTPVSPAATTSCDANITLTVPPACNASGWVCSTTNSDIALKDTDGNNRYDEAVFTNTSTGIGQTVSYEIKQSLDFYNQAFEKTHNYSITLDAATEHDFQPKVANHSSIAAMCASCPKGYRVATRSEVVASGLAEPDLGWWTTDLPDSSKISGVESGCRVPPAAESDAEEIFCPSETCGADLKRDFKSPNCKNSNSLQGNACYSMDNKLKKATYYCVSNTPTCG